MPFLATYLEPFALWTLGIARGDPALVAQAQERFEAMGLDCMPRRRVSWA
jgi:hypothetical protein